MDISLETARAIEILTTCEKDCHEMLKRRAAQWPLELFEGDAMMMLCIVMQQELGLKDPDFDLEKINWEKVQEALLN